MSPFEIAALIAAVALIALATVAGVLAWIGYQFVRAGDVDEAPRAVDPGLVLLGTDLTYDEQVSPIRPMGCKPHLRGIDGGGAA